MVSSRIKDLLEMMRAQESNRPLDRESLVDELIHERREEGSLESEHEFVSSLVSLLLESLSLDEFAARLGYTRAEVDQMVADRSIFASALYGPVLLPIFQLDGNSLLPAFEKVGPKIPSGMHLYSVDSWWRTLNSNLVLEGLSDEPWTPRDWLIAGHEPEPVGAELENLSLPT